MRRLKNFAAFAASKLVDFSEWSLPRNIGPSDVDAVIDEDGGMPIPCAIDNGRSGRVLFVEYKANSPCWRDVPTGQRRMYENLVSIGQGRIIAAVCQHTIPPEGCPIRSIGDVIAFQVMTSKGLMRVYPGHLWRAAVRHLLGF